MSESSTAESAAADEKLPGIRHIVAVASAKGGVGKSTVAVNLSLALAKLGQRVGLVDADILGPSVPGMLGLPAKPEIAEHDGRLLPAERHGIKAISMGMLTGDDAPAILRGPMVSKYIQLFVTDVRWGELDVLVIDLPPGTGDTQLTLAQRMPLSGAVIVTTPQDVSLKIARRGLRMFERVHVPILGIIENMSGFACPHCGETTHIFREGGGQKLADQTGVATLGKIPIDVDVVVGGDAGEPIVHAKPQSETAKAYAQLAEDLFGAVEQAASLALPAFDWRWDDPATAPEWRDAAVDAADGATTTPVGFRRDGPRTLSVLWQDGACHAFDVRDLRLACQCAHCVEEMTGRPLVDSTSIPKDVEPTRISSVGRYAVAGSWSDGHNSSIYAFDYLRRLGEESHSASLEV